MVRVVFFSESRCREALVTISNAVALGDFGCWLGSRCRDNGSRKLFFVLSIPSLRLLFFCLRDCTCTFPKDKETSAGEMMWISQRV